MLPRLSASLSNGLTVKRVTPVEKNRADRFIAGKMLTKLQSEYPAQLSPDAISTAFHVPQDVATLTAASFKGMPNVDVIFATPPCQPFSIAGSIHGWNSPESLPFKCCVNLIMGLFESQGQPIAYFIENVPNAAKFQDIITSLGQPIIVEAHRLGSSSLRKIAVSTNSAPNAFLVQHYQANQKQGDKIPQFLINQEFYDWKYTDSTSEYFPKFMSRYISWAYTFTADDKAGPGFLIHNNEFQEPSPEIKELSMGYDAGSTSIEGISTATRHKILGACMDLNVSRWLIQSSLNSTSQHSSARHGVPSTILGLN